MGDPVDAHRSPVEIEWLHSLSNLTKQHRQHPTFLLLRKNKEVKKIPNVKPHLQSDLNSVLIS